MFKIMNNRRIKSFENLKQFYSFLSQNFIDFTSLYECILVSSVSYCRPGLSERWTLEKLRIWTPPAEPGLPKLYLSSFFQFWKFQKLLSCLTNLKKLMLIVAIRNILYSIDWNSAEVLLSLLTPDRNNAGTYELMHLLKQSNL